MRILITGADGFVGGYLIKQLEKEGHIVFAHRLEDGDVSVPGTLEAYSEIDYVYHLAARTFVPASWDYTYDYFQTNIMSTVSVLEYCRKNNCGVSLMSTYVYGEPQYLPVDENHPTIALSPYHETKLICELLGEFYSKQFNLPVTAFRPFNIYGAGQNEAFLLPSVMKQILDPSINEIIVMDLNPKRDYVYIDDVIAVLCAATKLESAAFNVFNIGSGQSVSVENVIRTAMEVAGINKPYKSSQQTRKIEVSDCVADMKKVTDILGINIVYDLKAGLQKWLVSN